MWKWLRGALSSVVQNASYIWEQTKKSVSEKINALKKVHPLLDYVISRTQDVIDLCFSQSASHVLATLAAVSMLASPIGPVFGAVMCAVALSGVVASIALKTYRSRKFEDYRQGQDCIEGINQLNRSIAVGREGLTEDKQLTLDALAALAKAKIGECKSVVALRGEGKQRGALGTLAKLAKYFDFTSAQLGAISIANAALSANPVSIGYSVLSFVTSGASAVNSEAIYQGEKSKFRADLAEGQRSLAVSLGLDGKQINAEGRQISTQDLINVRNIKQAQSDVAKLVQAGKLDEKGISEEFERRLSVLTAQSQSDARKRNSFVFDMGKVVVRGFSSAQESRAMAYSTHIERRDGKAAGQSMELKEVSRHPASEHEHHPASVSASPKISQQTQEASVISDRKGSDSPIPSFSHTHADKVRQEEYQGSTSRHSR